MDEFSVAMNEAGFYLQNLVTNVSDILGGLIISLCLMLILRSVLKSFMIQWLGPKTGNFTSGLIEMLVSILFMSLAYRNPGVIITLVGWNAAIFRQLLIQFRTGGFF
ncbi:MAG: hypothetical protein FH756_10895 [Firmicutes bacterium]|nr:hypothetical protein [Bacillota bacterium]